MRSRLLRYLQTRNLSDLLSEHGMEPQAREIRDELACLFACFFSLARKNANVEEAFISMGFECAIW